MKSEMKNEMEYEMKNEMTRNKSLLFNRKWGG